MQKTKEDEVPSYARRCFLAGALVFLAIALTQLAALGMTQIGLITKFNEHLKMNSFLIAILQQAFIFTGLAWWFQKELGSSFFSFAGEIKLSFLLYGLIGLFGVNLFSGLVMKSMGVEVKQLEILSREAMKQNPYLFLFVVAFIAPLYEEFVFRGVILKMLYSKKEEKSGSVPYLLWAVVFSGALFALVHFDLDAAFPVFMLGAYFAWITIRTKSIFLSSTLHFVQNFLSGSVYLNDELIQQFGSSFLKII